MADPVPFRSQVATATILSGQSLSGAVSLAGRNVTGILLPAAWTAAGVTLSVSVDGVTYGNLYDVAGEVVLTAAASAFIGLNPATLIGFNFVKVRSGTSGAAVNQAADRVVVVMLGDFTR